MKRFLTYAILFLALVRSSASADIQAVHAVPKQVNIRIRMFQLPAKSEKENREQKKEKMIEFDTTLGNTKPFEFLAGGETRVEGTDQYQPFGFRLEGQVAKKAEQELMANLKITLTRRLTDHQPSDDMVVQGEIFELKSKMQPGVQKVVWLKTGQGRPRWLEMTITPRQEQ